MELRILGPLEVFRDGQPVDVRGSKRRTLLALLILHANQVVRTDRLIEELWGERLPSNASAALHNHVSRLRKDLGGDLLVTRPWGYVLRIDPSAVDLHRFESLVGEATALPALERRTKLAEALQLWQGPALAGLEHEPSLAVDIARLDDLRVTAIEQRIDADLELGAHERLVSELEGLVGEYPLRERLRGQLILALYRSGRQAEALETYRETRRVLVDELGIDPSPELRELERAILRQDPALASVAARPPPQVEDAAPPRWRWPRSPLVLGATLLFFLAGAAAAGRFVFPERGPSRRATPPSLATAATQRGTAVSARAIRLRTTFQTDHTEGQDRPAHTAAKATRAAHRAQPAPTRPQRPHHKAAAPPPPPPPPLPPPAPAPPPPPPPPPPPNWFYLLTDNFADPAVTVRYWAPYHTGTGIDAGERNGRLEFAITPDAVMDADNAVSWHYGTYCFLKGDFDATADFSLLTWPAMNGVNLSLGAWFPPPAERWLSIERNGGHSDGAPEIYGTTLDLNAAVVTDDMNGSLRLKRTNGTLSAYFRSGKRWHLLASKRAPEPAALVLMLFTKGDTFGRQGAVAGVDNVSATADAVACHGSAVPPRKRRHR